MSREELSNEELEYQLRDYFEGEYSDTRRPAELWRSLQPRLGRQDTPDALLPPERLKSPVTPKVALPTKRKAAAQDDWLPLPRGVKPTPTKRPRQRAQQFSFMPALLVACLVLAIGLAAYQIGRVSNKPVNGEAGSGPTAQAGASAEAIARSTSTAATQPVQGTLVLEMTPGEWLLRGDLSYNYRQEIDRNDTYSGAPSAVVRHERATPTGDVYLVRMLNGNDLAPLLGKRVRFSAYIKAEGVQELAELWLRPADYLPKYGSFDGTLNRPITGTTGWVRYEVTKDVPATSNSLTFGIRLVGDGKLWVDMARIEIMGQEVAVTGSPGLINGDFELGIDGWSVTSAGPTVEFTGTVVHGGSRSVALVGGGPSGRCSTPTATRLMPRVKQTVDVGRYAGKRIRVSAYMKSQNLCRWGTFYADLEDKSGNSSVLRAHDDFYSRPVPSTSDWAEYGIVMDVPSPNSVLTVGAFLDGGGTLYVDDVRIEEVSAEVPLTGAWVLDRQTNTDFEAGLSGWMVGGTFPGGYKVGLAEQDVHGGKASAYIGATSDLMHYQDNAMLEQWFDTSQVRGQRIRFSGYVRSSNVSRNVIFRVQVEPSENRSGTGAGLAEGTIYGRTGWERYELVIEVP